MLNLGVRAHDFGQLPADELATQIAAHGLTCVQLAVPKAIAGFDAATSRLTPGFAAHVRDAFQRRGLQVAVLGCYINLGDRDAAARRRALARFKDHLHFARDFGCSVVGTETGSVNSDFSRHPDNAGEDAFQTVLAGVRELVHEAEKFGVFVGVEGVERYVISSPRRLRRLVDEVGSPNVRVILDPVNLLCADNHHRQDEIVEEACTLLGDRIAVVHAKDFALVGGRFEERPAGEGELHYAPLLRWIKTHAPGIHLLLENTAPATIGGTAAFLRQAYAEA